MKAVAVAAGLDDVGVVGDSVNDGCGEAWVGDDLAPFAEWQVRCDRDGRFLFSFGDDLEDEFSALGVELDVAELVEAEQVIASVAGDESGELPVCLCFCELVRELGCCHVTDPVPCLTRGMPETDQQVALSGSGVAEENDGVAGRDVVALGEGGDRCRVDSGCVGVEIVEAFSSGEPGFFDPACPAAFVTGVDFVSEDLGEKPEMGGFVSGCLGGKVVVVAADCGEFELGG